jgi:predicted membrane-bound mannosyltransferase
MSTNSPVVRSQAVLDERNRSHANDQSVVPGRWTCWVAFLLVAVLGLLIRLPHLDVRPMHTDEAVNAYIVGQVLGGNSFSYDPRDRHGPLLVAVALPLARMQRAKNFA